MKFATICQIRQLHGHPDEENQNNQTCVILTSWVSSEAKLSHTNHKCVTVYPTTQTNGGEFPQGANIKNYGKLRISYVINDYVH